MKTQLRMFVATLSLFAVTAWSCNTSNWLALAEQDIPVLTTEAVSILNLVDPSGSDAALANKISTSAQAAVKAVKDAVDVYNLNPTATTLQKVQAALDAASSELATTLQAVAGQFTNQTDLAIITAAVTGIIVTFDLIASQIGPAPAAKVRLAKATKPVGNKIPNAQQLRANWNKNVCGLAPASCPAL